MSLLITSVLMLTLSALTPFQVPCSTSDVPSVYSVMSVKGTVATPSKMTTEVSVSEQGSREICSVCVTLSDSYVTLPASNPSVVAVVTDIESPKAAPKMGTSNEAPASNSTVLDLLNVHELDCVVSFLNEIVLTPT